MAIPITKCQYTRAFNNADLLDIEADVGADCTEVQLQPRPGVTPFSMAAHDLETDSGQDHDHRPERRHENVRCSHRGVRAVHRSLQWHYTRGRGEVLHADTNQST